MLRRASTTVALTCAVPCLAAPCRVEVTGAESPEWRRAALSLDTAGLTGDDCAQILVEVVENGAQVAFVTADGRRAERTLADPDELRATVEALRVTGPPPPEGAAPPANESSAAAPQKAAPEVHAQSPTSPSTLPAREGAVEHEDRNLLVIFGLHVGVRGDGTLVSPVLSGSIGVVKQRWEVAVTVASEVHYAEVQGPEPMPSPELREGSALVLGASIGRREPAFGVALRAGARASVAALFHDNAAGPAVPVVDNRSSEGRLGVYVGMAVPRRSSIRFRADLAAEGVVTQYPDTIATTPRWSVTALLGAEIGGT